MPNHNQFDPKFIQPSIKLCPALMNSILTPTNSNFIMSKPKKISINPNTI